MSSNEVDSFESLVSSISRSIYDVAAIGEPAPQAEIQRLEAVSGVKVPDAFRECLESPANGLSVSVKEELWPAAKVGEIRPFWAHLYGFGIFGIGEDIPENLDFFYWLEILKAHGLVRLMPFMKVLADENFVYAFDRSQAIVKVWLDGSNGIEQVGRDFLDLFKKEFQELDQRRINFAQLIKQVDVSNSLHRARTLLSEGKLVEAISEFEMAMQVDVKNFPTQAAVMLGDTYIRAGQLDKSIELCSRLIERADFSANSQTWGHSALVLRAIARAKSGLTGEAIKDLDAAVRAYEFHPEPFFYRAQILEFMGMTERAFDDRTTMVQLGLRTYKGFDLAISGPDQAQLVFESPARS